MLTFLSSDSTPNKATLSSSKDSDINFVGVIKEVMVCNVDGSASADITLQITDTSASATFSLLSTKSIAADDFLRIEDAHIILEEGDILKAQAGAANDLEVTAFVEEFHRPQG